MRILICGGTGFIGKNIINHFSKFSKFNIRSTYFKSDPINDLDVEWVKADLRNRADVKKVVKNVDVILQYAATTTGSKDILSKPYMHVTDNAIINSLLIRESFESNVRHFIFPSCTIMYKHGDAVQKETDYKESDGIYEKYYGAGHTKLYLEKMCKFFSGLNRTKFTILRQSNIYGPHDKFNLDTSHVLGATITKVMTSSDKLTVLGDGSELRDFLFVNDLVDLISKVINKQDSKYELINTSYGKSISINSLVETIIKISGKQLKVNHDITKPSIPVDILIDNNRAFELFKWKPSTSLYDGLKETIIWYKNNTLDLISKNNSD